MLLVTVIVVTACNTGLRVIRGSGNVVTEARQVSNFDSVELSGSGEVIVTQSGSESLTIETDDNVMEYIKAEVENGTLKLGLVTGLSTGVNVQSTTRLVFYLDVKDISSLSVSGSGEIDSDKIESNQLKLSISGSGRVQIADLVASEVGSEVSGSGEINLAGEVARQEVSISGSGAYLAGDLCSEFVRVSTSGSGDSTVCATETLEVSTSGSGTVSYYGSPAVSVSGSGSGNLQSLGEK